MCLDLVALLDMTDPDPVRAVAVARGRRGLLVVQGKLAVSFSRMRATMIAGALVALLPDTRAALGNSITQPAAALRADQPKHRRVKPGGVLRTAAPRDAADSKLRAIAAIMDKPVRRAGQLGMTVTDEAGKRHRQPGMAWFDTDDGRYATTMTRGRDGDDWVTLWPADNTRLTHRLSETIARG